MAFDVLDQVVAHFGSKSRLARAVGTTRQAINGWRARGVVPPSKAIRIEMITGGKFKALDLTRQQMTGGTNEKV
jgi:hypothetical protein